jgi:hypothetical protein
MRSLRFAAATAAILSASCGPGGAGSGEMEVAWTKPTPGRFRAPAKAIWCAEDHRLELMAASGDTGLGLVLYPGGALQADLYPVMNPILDTVVRPGAAVAFRWFSETQVRGLQADSGDVGLARAHPPLAGSFTIRLRPVEGTDTFRFTGRFSGLSPEPCPSPIPAPPAPR